MEFLLKRYAQSHNITRLEANLLPSSFQKTPALSPNPIVLNKSDKFNGLDGEIDSTIKIIWKNGNVDKRRTNRHKCNKNLLLRGLDEPSNRNDNCVLHVHYNGREAALVCQVKTANLSSLKERLSPLLKDYKSRFRAVHGEKRLFKQMGFIHVLMTGHSVVDFANLEEHLHKVSLSCQAESCRIVSIEMGALCFRCHPAHISKVAGNLRQFGYNPLLTEIGYCPIEPLVKLRPPELTRYSEFLKQLQADADIVKVYDNVQNSVLQSMYTN
ncbi:uncharacterized protein LOC111596210 [Drosophila hydei]|uniref:Uncharacterized protein LOC111596210 n=1 Tax=Drosophila hydei TaxID=7224 RepID=A0A6J1LQX0_DROHY|nr:uncharacterized protein LOC111596210 [Drosophila hydei]